LGGIAAVGAVLAVAGQALAAPPMMTVNTGAKLTVLSPKSGAVITGNSVATDISVSNFKLDCSLAGTANRKGVGHYHIELDHSLVDMYCSKSATISLLDVKPGKHTLSFVPAADDHAEDMKATKMVSFVYKPASALPAAKPLQFSGKPSVAIVSPKTSGTVHGGFDLVVDVKNFTPSCALYGKANVAGYGHWHVNVDSLTQGMMGMGTMMGMSCAHSMHVSTAGLKPGQHTFYAILVDNTHAPTIGVKAAITLTVK
jgi:hypothetical protein